MDLKDLLPKSPQKEDVLFASDKTLWRMDAILDPRSGDVTYREGYRRAARLLTQHVALHGEADFLVFPICHSYRHYIELMLKRLVIVGCRVAGREMSTRESRLQSEKHDLRGLWEAFKSIESEINRALDEPPRPPEDMAGIEAYIDQIHGLDAGSFSFRYPLTKKGEPSLEGVERINLGRLSQYMERLCDYLEGFDAYYCHLIDMESEAYGDCGPDGY